VDNTKAIAGWYVNSEGWIFGCILQSGVWTSYKDPELRKGTSNITELLGINDAGLAVGFYQDDHGISHGFELNETTGKFHGLTPPGGINVEATGINGKGDIVGFMTIASGITESFLLKGGSYTIFSYSGALSTEALAINWQDQIVGSTVLAGSKSITHGFILTDPLQQPTWQEIDEPKADGTTVVASIENHDYMVGYYIDGSGLTNGFVATPAAPK